MSRTPIKSKKRREKKNQFAKLNTLTVKSSDIQRCPLRIVSHAVLRYLVDYA